MHLIPRLWANHHMVDYRSVRARAERGWPTSIPTKKRLHLVQRLSFVILATPSSCQLGSFVYGSHWPLLKAASAMPVGARSNRIGKEEARRRRGGHINEPGLHDPRVLVPIGLPADVKVFIYLLLIDRALPGTRLLFAQPGYCSSWQATLEPEATLYVRSGVASGPATGPSANDGVCRGTTLSVVKPRCVCVDTR